MIELSVQDFLASDDATLVDRLAHQAIQHFRTNEPAQLRAWIISLRCLRAALAGWPAAAAWHLVLEYPMRRLARRIDAVLATPRAILVLEFKAGATTFAQADQAQVEDYALDLQDFHAASRGRVIVPILVATNAQPRPPTWPLAIGGATHVLEASAETLPTLLRDLWARLPAAAAASTTIDVPAWSAAPYRPVPGIVDAARTLYARNSVAEIADAGAEAHNLRDTTDAILAACRAARDQHHHIVLFVTGTPGAGKTLCGLNVVFGAAHPGSGRQDHATFLTGNPTLVHVLREALVRDAVDRGEQARAARQRMRGAIQALPHFRDDNLGRTDPPVDRIAVIDEAQRSWSRENAIRASADRAVQLTDSEPGHLLDIMARHPDWAVMICLIGNGQEIHTGEGGLAEWGTALAARPAWRVHAAPQAIADQPDARQRLPALPGLVLDAALHLDIPMRSIRNPAAAAWAEAVLHGNTAAARAIAARGELPFVLTRDLATLRALLRAEARGQRRAGLVGSSGAKRLRAEGLGVEVDHMDPNAVARWFLDRWPQDVRASDALETIATEFACQGLELDAVGLCWGGDLIRLGATWQVRHFSGTDWQIARAPERRTNRLNTYRVLMTRARYRTVIWIPRGDTADRTRTPADFDAIAEYLRTCGAPDAEQPGEVSPAGPLAQPSLV